MGVCQGMLRTAVAKSEEHKKWRKEACRESRDLWTPQKLHMGSSMTPTSRQSLVPVHQSARGPGPLSLLPSPCREGRAPEQIRPHCDGPYCGRRACATSDVAETGQKAEDHGQTAHSVSGFSGGDEISYGSEWDVWSHRM